MKKLALIGECMIELNGEPFGTMRQTYGGDTLNTATYVARVSSPERIQVCYVSALGTDKLSQGMIDRWQGDGIQTDWVLRDKNRSAGLYLIQLDKQGERTFLYWRNQSAARYLLQHPDYPQVLSALKSADMIYLSGISLAILPENDRTLLIAQLRELKKAGVEIAFDSNFRPKLWDSLAQAQACYRALLPLVDVALVTFDDEEMLWSDTDEQATITRLSAFDIPKIIVKQGSLGATICENGTQTFVPTIPVENVTDTTSAGDSFNAGFLAGYLQGKPLTVCCEQGNRLAGIVIQHKGAIIDPAATEALRAAFN
ncbi:sugar kinase [Actinobacillus succinogenes]|uniref:2-dehydro-3-deoxygluconokinase n=1 Tax=Actinobacillus succinogenes (strain ATCC 55618 / DSM 22257 / CCUG 43843 / 130Z) TaxID=339671 RepID=A6VKN6_ACTSZ|nr:sugar kinase [Actinobacillus succinogenes]ABR73533.1 PfkB domain protein [Actinobacillus succinogenes 130Z]PHI40004.1 sugar kinase [Actinobacillus succinogenes]